MKTDTRFKLWFDCEVTDFDPQKGAMHQVAALIEVDDEVIDTIDIKIDPTTYPKGCKITPYNLERCKTTEHQIKSYPNQKLGISEFIEKIEHYQTHFILCGHNIIKHDLRFLEQWFLQNGFNIYDYITYNPLDTLAIAIFARDLGYLSDLEGNSLEDLCQYFDVSQEEWHKASDDARAVREMYGHLSSYVQNGGEK
jgi:DNA polymerase III alpha subunit (gram-positive type)